MAENWVKYINLLLGLGIVTGLAIFIVGIFQSALSTNATANQAMGTILQAFSNFVSEYVPPLFSIVAIVLIVWLVKKLGLF
jgi:type II secretory pathway component PulF